MRRWAWAAALIFAAAAYLRLPSLADRPMHADEAVYAYKLGTLLETGAWAYDPGEYHGPVLHYLTAGAARVAGARRYLDLTEKTLRIVPALLGLALVATPLLLATGLGRAQATAACAFIAVSPAMVYYSRYYIPEMLLTCLTAALISVGYRYVSTQRLRWALIAGFIFGLMFATKETALLAAGSFAVAGFVAAGRRLPRWRHLLAGVAVAVGTIAFLLGPADAVQAIVLWASRGVQSERHVQPWHYYLHLLLWWRQGGPVWSEALIVMLAVLGAMATFMRPPIPGTDPRLLRFLTLYTLCMAVVYSLIPYKTPWCLLGFLYGLILLAGVGLVFLIQRVSGLSKPITAVVLALAGAHLLLQAFQISRRYSSDPRSPYVYAHTARDVFTIRENVEKIAASHESGRDLPIQVISTQNLWPLPWYLRAFPRVEWRRAITDDMKPAPVILASPEFEPMLLRQLYEVLPPGQRPLYVSLFPDHTELRRGTEIRGYVQQSVWAISELANPAPR